MTSFSRVNNTNKKYNWLILIAFSVLLFDLVYSLISYNQTDDAAKSALVNGLYISIFTAAAVSGVLFFLIAKLRFTDHNFIQLQAIIEACPVPIIINDRDENIILVNHEFEHVFGYSSDDLPNLEKWWHKAYPDSQYRLWIRDRRKTYLEAMRSHSSHPESFKVNIKCADNSYKSVLISATPLEGNYRDLELLVFYDVTEQMDTIGSLVRSKTILTSIIETIPLRLFWKDKNLTYLGCNSAFARDAGMDEAAEIIGKKDDQLIWHEQASQYQADDKAVMNANKPIIDFEEPQTTVDGSQRILRTSKVPLHDSDGNVIGMLGIYDDISQLKKIEEDLWLSQTILDKCETAFFRLNKDGAIEYANEYAVKRLGYNHAELLGMHAWDFDVDLTEQQWPAIRETLATKGTIQFEARHRRKTGEITDLLVTEHNIRFHDKQFIFAIVQDISLKKQQERELQQKEGYLRSLIDSLPFFVWLKDRQSKYLAVNQKVLTLVDNIKDPNQFVGMTDIDIHPFELAEAYRRDDQLVMMTQEPKLIEEEIRKRNGSTWIETYKAPILDSNGTLLGTVGYARNITEQKKIETELRIAATAFESQEGMVITDADHFIIKVNRAFTRITGFTSEEAIGHKMNILKSDIHDQKFYEQMWQQIREQGGWQGEIWNRRKTGEIYPEWLTVTAVRDKQGHVTHYIGNMIDITSRKAIEQQVHHLAHHDALTDLPNRLLLTDRLQQAIAHARRKKTELALLYLDLDKFKPVNDTLGHDIGDQLLCEVAERLLQCVKRETDTVSRLGGDEFVVLLSQVEDQKEAAIVAERIVFALNQSFSISENNIEISCSIGIAVYPRDGEDAINLMKNADNAMYEAKNAGRSCYRFYSSEKHTD